MKKKKKKAGAVMGTVFQPQMMIVQRGGMLHKMKNTMDHNAYPLHKTMTQQSTDYRKFTSIELKWTDQISIEFYHLNEPGIKICMYI